MAVLKYTLADLKGAAAHACGKDSSSIAAGNSLLQIVNSALDYVARAHPWHWRTKFATLDVTSGEATVDLPADFAELIHLAGAASPYLTKRFRPVDEWELPVVRQQAAAVAANTEAAKTVFYAVSGKAQASVTALRLYQLQVHPAAPSTTSACLALVYRSMPPALASDTDVPDVPTEAQDLLLQFVRAFAQIRENVQNAKADWEIAQAMLESQRALNDRLRNPSLPKLANVINDYFAVSGVSGTWS